MNVLIAMPLGEFGGGAEQMLYNYLAYRTRDSHVQVFMLFMSPGSLSKATADLGYPTAVIPAGRIREVHRLLATQYKVNRLIATWKIDRVLAWMPKACAYVALPSWWRDNQLLMWRHDIPHSLGYFDRFMLRYGRAVGIACSSEIAKRALEGNGFERLTTRAIHPGVAPRAEPSASAVEEIRRKVLGGGRGLIIGTVTRLQPWKRVDLFLRAVACLKERIPQVKAVVVGGESHGLSKGHGNDLKLLGKSLLGDDVTFVGEQRNVEDWLKAMDVFVLPSDGEPFGIALVEALIAGKPVIACSGGGPEEIIGDDSVGILLPSAPRPEVMAHAIETMLDPDVRREAVTANPEFATRFSPEKMSKNIDEWLSAAY